MVYKEVTQTTLSELIMAGIAAVVVLGASALLTYGLTHADDKRAELREKDVQLKNKDDQLLAEQRRYRELYGRYGRLQALAAQIRAYAMRAMDVDAVAAAIVSEFEVFDLAEAQHGEANTNTKEV